jgi:hypothetical protein
LKLRLVKCLLDHGHRPGKLMGAATEELSGLLRMGAPTSRDACAANPMLALLDLRRSEELRGALGKSLARHGLQRFVTEILAPPNAAVGGVLPALHAWGGRQEARDGGR